MGQSTFEKVDLDAFDAPFRVYKLEGRNLPDDWDYKGHMNNAYAPVLTFLRM